MTSGEISVEVTFDNAQEKLPIALPKVAFRKLIDVEGRVRHFISNAAVSADNYYRYLEYAGVGRLASLTLSSHKRLEEIVRLNGTEVFQTLKELTGIRVYEKKRDESLALLSKATVDEGKAEEILKEINDRLELLRHNMREYRKFEQNEQEMGVIKALINQKKVEELEAKLLHIAENEATERVALEQLQPKIEELSREMQQQIDQVEAAERFIDEFRKAAEAGAMTDTAESLSGEQTMSGLEERSRVEKEINNQLRTIEADLVVMEKRRLNMRREIAGLEAEYKVIQNAAEMAAAAAQKDPNSKASMEAKKKDLEGAQKSLEEKLGGLKKEMEEVRSELTDLQRSEADWQKTHEAQQARLRDLTAKSDQLRKHLAPLEEEKLKSDFRLTTSQDTFVRVFDNLIRDASAANEKKMGVDVMHLFSLVRHFTSRYPGTFISLLIDLIDIRETLRIPLEALYLPKLFAIVVEDEKAVEKVIQLNREIGGGRISVKTLSGILPDRDAGETGPRAKESAASYEDELKKKRIIRLKDWVSLKHFETPEARFGFLDFVMAHKGLAPKVDSFIDGVLNNKGLVNPSLYAFLNFAFKASRTRPPSLDVSILDQTNVQDVSEASFVHPHGFHDRIDALVRKTFKKGAVVMGLSDAHKYSKEMGVSCATREGEVVHAGGLLAKVGFVNPAKNAIFLYEKISAGIHNLRAVADELGRLLREKAAADKARNDTLSQTHQVDGEREAIRTKLSMTAADVQFLREKIHKKNLKIGELEALMERRETELRLTTKMLDNLANPTKQKGKDGADKADPKDQKAKEAQFAERLKTLTYNLGNLEQELLEVRQKHQATLKSKELTLSEASRQTDKTTAKKNRKDTLAKSMDSPEVRQKRDVIAKARRRFEELQKAIRGKKEEADVRAKLHVTLVSQLESHKRRIGEIREKVVS